MGCFAIYRTNHPRFPIRKDGSVPLSLRMYCQRSIKKVPLLLDLICAGVALVDSIIRGFDPKPVSASGYRAVSGSLAVGGEAVNEAIAAARLGLRTGILCRLGRDAAGNLLISALEQAGVRTDRVVREGATPVSTLFVNGDGTRRSITNEAHRQPFHPENAPALFTDAKALMLGSLFRSPFDDPAVVYAVVSRAWQAGQIVFADTKLPNFRVLRLDDLADSLPLIHYITPNEDEAGYYTGKTAPEEMADVFLRFGVQNVIIKLGAKGCLLKNRDTAVRLPAFPVRAVDATGAGDCFLAGFASELLRGAPQEDALRFANACGAICATAVGAGTALQSRAQVLSFLSDQTGQPSQSKE